MRRGVALLESIEAGARNQWRYDSGRVIGVMHFRVPGRSIYCDDMTADPLDPDKVQKARHLEVEYFRQRGV